jgi:hypothetical protein
MGVNSSATAAEVSRRNDTLIATVRHRWRERIDRPGERLAATRQQARVAIKRTYRFVFAKPPQGWSDTPRLEVFNEITARVKKDPPSENVDRSIEIDHQNNSWGLTLRASGPWHSTDVSAERTWSRLVDLLDDEAGTVRAAANQSRVLRYKNSNQYWEWDESTDKYFQSTELSIDLDDPMARSLQDPDRLSSLLTEAMPNTGERMPTFRYDSSIGTAVPGTQLILRSENGSNDAEKVAGIILGAVPPVQPAETMLETWRTPSVRYWGTANLLLVAMSLVLAPFPVSLITLAVAGIVLLLVDAAAARAGYMRGARLDLTLLGLTPVTIVFVFAIIYGWLSLDPPGMISPLEHAPATWVDSLLLSLDVASFGGFLDLQLHSLALRWTAYLEMLSLASIGGITLYHTAQSLWSALRDLRRPVIQG